MQVNQVNGKAPENGARQIARYRVTVEKLNPRENNTEPATVVREGIGVAAYVYDGDDTHAVAIGTINGLAIVRGLIEQGVPAERIISTAVAHLAFS